MNFRLDKSVIFVLLIIFLYPFIRLFEKGYSFLFGYGDLVQINILYIVVMLLALIGFPILVILVLSFFIVRNVKTKDLNEFFRISRGNLVLFFIILVPFVFVFINYGFGLIQNPLFLYDLTDFVFYPAFVFKTYRLSLLSDISLYFFLIFKPYFLACLISSLRKK